ncbi:hypothetical protein JTE90_006727 [Oedothorax gibbosus]|uniref:Uncharacterized protein n=1 Tax=Oedothorax gibbosus TaxID=931172 RepID=A0AAV6UAL1_9ARAC|nr:hypothetical protein JTE90_006727 [Oedothorax gibbosus]
MARQVRPKIANSAYLPHQRHPDKRSQARTTLTITHGDSRLDERPSTRTFLTNLLLNRQIPPSVGRLKRTGRRQAPRHRQYFLSTSLVD